MKEGHREGEGNTFKARMTYAPSAQRSDDWSCPKLKTNSGDKYSDD